VRLTRGLELLDDQRLQARVGAPVDGARVVPGDVGAVPGELDAASALMERRAARAAASRQGARHEALQDLETAPELLVEDHRNTVTGDGLERTGEIHGIPRGLEKTTEAQKHRDE
jgi:hypothetical protein